ncbi:exonuclease SbcCD subunit D C-terminal domain-containing protein [Billgrantia tianxiuensis]|uniref:exonuclease SbcCD subunit D C-terminal domain-containing protein n=1 Tax=Billgrantia tianxiuensis TaxID=2497861 RepID=UPI001F2A8DE5|nr:exonuclease SbcCD subunit D C-terminal domain-containing protein [Halomonas tianxiuensis]
MRVELSAPVPDLRAQVEAVLEGKAVRLLRLERRLPQHEGGPASERVDLEQLGPRRLFQRTWEKQWGEPPGDDVLADFDRLLQDVLDDATDDTSAEGRS